MSERFLITGGAGFIGSALIRRVLAGTDASVVNVDKLTYSATKTSLATVSGSPRYVLKKIDIRNRVALNRIFDEFRPTAVIHLAAETHVDRSIDGPSPFIQTNVVGTCVVLEVATTYRQALAGTERERFRLLHVSTDEVFGSQDINTCADEASPYNPSSPYSASKAASDHLVRAWGMTYGLPVIVSRCSNNYGPFQFPEKLIPLTIIRALSGSSIGIYGKGDQRRDWLHVEDHCDALMALLNAGRIGDTYNVGGGAESANVDVARAICRILDKQLAKPPGTHEALIKFVEDRPGHDWRYAVDSEKIRRELGWRPRWTFESGLKATVLWYLENRNWWEPLLKNRYQGERLGRSFLPGL